MTSPRRDIAIFGAGGFGREVLMLLRQIDAVTPSWNVVGFYDDQAADPVRLDAPYLGGVPELQRVDRPLALVLAIGSGETRARVRAQLTNPRLDFPVIIHPSVELRPFQHNTIGEGTVICSGCVLTTNIVIGRHAVLNLLCTIGHEVVLEDYASLMPRVDVGGASTIGAEAYVGSSATILPVIRIGAGTTVGAGAVVNKDLPPRCTAVGVPARVIKQG
jgi:sugar O-acyltransferase (sialic acid O-acetyltransferase NeuD family)